MPIQLDYRRISLASRCLLGFLAAALAIGFAREAPVTAQTNEQLPSEQLQIIANTVKAAIRRVMSYECAITITSENRPELIAPTNIDDIPDESARNAIRLTLAANSRNTNDAAKALFGEVGIHRRIERRWFYKERWKLECSDNHGKLVSVSIVTDKTRQDYFPNLGWMQSMASTFPSIELPLDLRAPGRYPPAISYSDLMDPRQFSLSDIQLRPFENDPDKLVAMFTLTPSIGAGDQSVETVFVDVWASKVNDFLPSKMQVRLENLLTVESEYTYERYSATAIPLLKRADFRYFDDKPIGSSDWHQQNRYELQWVSMNDPMLEDVFTMKTPDQTDVFDTQTGTTRPAHAVPDMVSPKPHSTQRRWIVILGVFAIVGVAVMCLWSRLRNRD